MTNNTNNNETKLMYIHIPKTCGTCISKTFKNQIIYGGHTFVIPYENQSKKLEKYILNNDHKSRTGGRGLPNIIDGHHSPKLTSNIKTFTIIRNPFDMLCSLYFHDNMKGFGWIGGESHPESIVNIKSFKEFIHKYCSNDWNYAGGFPCPYLKINLYQQIFNANGDLGVDIILFYEKLNDGLKYLKDEYNLSYFTLEMINKTTKKKNYKQYYDSEMIELVNKKCHNELTLFNYSFDGYKGQDNVILKNEKKINIEPLS